MFSDARGDVGYHRVQWSSNRVDVGRPASRRAGSTVRAGKLPGDLPVRDQPARLRRRASALARSAARRRRARHPRAGWRSAARSTTSRRSATCGRACRCWSQGDGGFEEVDRRVGRGRGLRRSRLRPRGGSHAHLRGRRRARPQQHLPLSGRRHPQHPRVRGGVPRRHGDRARAELPLDPDHPRRRQRGHRQQPRAQAEGAVDRRRATARPSCATTPTTRATRASGWPTRSRTCTTAAHRWGDVAVFYRTNAQSRVIEEQLMRSGIPYKVIGGTRFYDRREVKDALAYLKAVVNPVDEVSVKRVLNVPKRGVGDSTVGRLDAWANAPRRAPSSRRCAAATRPASRARRSRASRPSSALIDELAAELEAGTGPAHAARGGRSTARATSPSSRPSTASRPRAGSRTWPSWSARPASSSRSTSSSSRSALVADTDELDDDESSVRAHDAALGQGPRVPRRVPDRHGGRRLPAPALDRRARRARGGAPPRLRRHHPGPRAAVPVPRLEPHAVRLDAVQPAEPVPRRDPRAPGRAGRGAGGSRAASARPCEPVGSGRGSGPAGPARRGIRSARSRPRLGGRTASGWSTPRWRRRRRSPAGPTSSGCRSATTCATPPSAKGSSSASRARATRPQALVHFAGVGDQGAAAELGPAREDLSRLAANWRPARSAANIVR